MLVALRLISWLFILGGLTTFFAAVVAGVLVAMDRDLPLIAENPEWWVLALAAIAGLAALWFGVWFNEYIEDRRLRVRRRGLRL